MILYFWIVDSTASVSIESKVIWCLIPKCWGAWRISLQIIFYMPIRVLRDFISSWPTWPYAPSNKTFMCEIWGLVFIMSKTIINFKINCYLVILANWLWYIERGSILFRVDWFNRLSGLKIQMKTCPLFDWLVGWIMLIEYFVVLCFVMGFCGGFM